MALGRLWVELDAAIGGFEAKMGLAVAEIKKLEKAHGDQASAAERAAKVGGIALAAIGVTVAGVGIEAVKMAGNFEASQLRLVTTAGESASNLKMVSDGVLDMAGRVGVSADELSKALYVVESAGYHGADGLKVLEAASKGARIEGADVKEVADAVSSALVDYHLSADHATEVTNTLVAAVGHGKTTMQALSSAMPNVMAAAAAAGVSFTEASSALATMTMHGTDASTAGTYLRQVILGLENPTAKARHVMHSLGLDANEVSQNLGKNGLASTIAMVEDAIKTHLNPAGLVAIETLKKAHGSVDAFDKVLANLPDSQKTAIGALADMVGGVKNLQGFLQLGGENLEVFRKNTEDVAKQVKDGGKDIDGWNLYQQTFNAKVAAAKEQLHSLMIKIGTDLLPIATRAMDMFSHWAGIMERHHDATVQIAGAIGGILVTALALWTAMTLKAFAVSSAAFVTDVIKGSIWVASKLAQFVVIAGAAVISAGATAAAWIAANWAIIGATGGVALAIGLLVVAGVWLYNHWDQVWGAIKRWSTESWHWIKRELIDPLIQGWHALGDGFVWLYEHVLLPIWQGIKVGVVDPLVTAWRAVGDALGWLYDNVFQPVWHAIAAVVEWAWNNVLRPIIEVALIASVALARAEMAVLKAAWEAVWGAISTAAKWAWENVLRPTFNAIMDFGVKPVAFAIGWLGAQFVLAWRAVTDAAKWAWENVLKPTFDAIVEYGVKPVEAAVRWLGDRWTDAMNAVTDAAKWAWENVLKPTFDAIVGGGLWFLRQAVQFLADSWHSVWGWISDVARWAWENVLRPVFGAVNDNGIRPVADTISWLGDVWHSVWGGIVDAMNWAWGIIKRIGDWISNTLGSIGRAISGVSNAIHSVAGSMGVSLPGFDEGGWVPGSPGQPMLAVVHGGEYVLSQDMLAGRVVPDIPTSDDRGQPPSGSVLASGRGGTAVAAGGGNVYVHLEVHGTLMPERELFSHFQTHVLEKALRNSTNGLTLARS